MPKLIEISSKLVFALSVILIFFVIRVMVTTDFIEYNHIVGTIEWLCLIAFSFPFYHITRELKNKNRMIKIEAKYVKKLTEVLISQTHNELFYAGNTTAGAMILTREVAKTIDADRCSIWLYGRERNSILCQQLYVAAEDSHYQGIELFKKDFPEYFLALEEDPIIVAHNAETHKATSCFLEGYLKPLGVKSMLDVPVWHRGQVIGVVCIESKTPRTWKKVEIDFAQLLSSLYSFAYSVKEGNSLTFNLQDMENFIDSAALISKADASGKIIYANEKFTKVSGWSAEEVMGQDHNIVNSGVHPKSFWKKMYRETVAEKKIWNAVVTNRRKDGSLYYVDTYIKANFDSDTGELVGFTSIRQDVTQIINSMNEVNKKNTYLEHAAKIIRHDMHSGINTYIPRGLSSLERRLSEDAIKNLKIEAPIKMIKEGLKHTQKVYKGVYEFTNLVKKDAELTKTECNIKTILEDYLSATAYRSQVILDDNLPTIEVNEPLFCTAVDNLIRNGLKYNDSDTKIVKVYFEKTRKRMGLSKRFIIIEDNGRGIGQEDFERLSHPYSRPEGQKESGTGLGLNICKAILSEHGFEVTAERLEQGTRLKINITKYD